MKPIHRLSLKVFADYHQFYIWDPELSQRHAPEDYTQTDVENRVKIAEGVLVVQPVRNATVPVEISIWESEPAIHYAEWQHIALAPLSVPNGIIEIDECTGSPHAELTVVAGDYTARCLFKGLDTLSWNGLDGRDFYSIQLWPGKTDSLQIIKRWTVDTV